MGSEFNKLQFATPVQSIPPGLGKTTLANGLTNVKMSFDHCRPVHTYWRGSRTCEERDEKEKDRGSVHPRHVPNQSAQPEPCIVHYHKVRPPPLPPSATALCSRQRPAPVHLSSRQACSQRPGRDRGTPRRQSPQSSGPHLEG